MTDALISAPTSRFVPTAGLAKANAPVVALVKAVPPGAAPGAVPPAGCGPKRHRLDDTPATPVGPTLLNGRRWLNPCEARDRASEMLENPAYRVPGGTLAATVKASESASMADMKYPRSNLPMKSPSPQMRTLPGTSRSAIGRPYHPRIELDRDSMRSFPSQRSNRPECIDEARTIVTLHLV